MTTSVEMVYQLCRGKSEHEACTFVGMCVTYKQHEDVESLQVNLKGKGSSHFRCFSNTEPTTPNKEDQVKNIGLLALKAKVCGLEGTARKLSSKINESSGMQRWLLRHHKQQLGRFTREHLVAYGLLRGIPYSKIEPKCLTGPNVETIAKIIHEHVAPWERQQRWSADSVQSLLKNGGGA